MVICVSIVIISWNSCAQGAMQWDWPLPLGCNLCPLGPSGHP